jgi:hypothetical protein
MAAPQVGYLNNEGYDCLRIWSHVNGFDLANSNVEYCASPPDATVLIQQAAVCFEEGDVFSLRYSTNKGNAAMVALYPKGEPMVPSIIFTGFRIGDC